MENQLIKSELYDLIKIKKKIISAGIIGATVLFVVLTIQAIIFFMEWYSYYKPYNEAALPKFYEEYGRTGIGYALVRYVESGGFISYLIICLGIVLIAVLIGNVFYSKYSKISLVVTDKNVYGMSAFDKHIDLPLDKISAVALSGNKGITISTASGVIKFDLIKNRSEIYDILNDLLVDRQNRKNVEGISYSQNNSNADELKKFKDLLDSGIISQEEFDAKKKQLLGL